MNCKLSARGLMGNIKFYTAEKLVMGMLIADPGSLGSVLDRLTALWGETDSLTDAARFSFSDYYVPEMGGPLYRVFCSFRPLVSPEDLAGIKIRSNRLEEELARNGRRTVNLDPGILCQSKFILASTKNNAHRVPLRNGIYGELTLQYRKGAFRSLDWTYPDYREESARNYLLRVRRLYVEQLKKKQ